MADYLELRAGMQLMVPSPDGVLAGYFRSAVRRIDRRGLLIDIPRLDGEDLPLESGQTLRMFVQVHGRLYEFESQVRSTDLQVLLDEPGAVKRTERREFFRLLLTIPGQITTRRLLDDGEEEVTSEDISVVDVSGGGARIRTDHELAVGTQFELEFSTDRRVLTIASEVVRSTVTELARGGNRFEAHCMFTDIRRGDQDEIVRFLFLKQREFSARGVA